MRSKRHRVRKSPSWFSRAKLGFTLLEVLTVIAIVGVLFAIVLSVFGRATASAKRTSCASNIKQIAAALTMYADVSDGGLSFSTDMQNTWLEATGIPDIKSVGKCPSFDYQEEDRPGGNPNLRGYALNSCLMSKITVSEPARTVLVTETTTFHVDNSSTLDPRSLSGPDVFEYGPNSPHTFGGEYWEPVGSFGAVRHSGGCLYAFTDGHVRWLRPSQLRLPKEGYGCPELISGTTAWQGPAAGPRFSTSFEGE